MLRTSILLFFVAFTVSTFADEEAPAAVHGPADNNRLKRHHGGHHGGFHGHHNHHGGHWWGMNPFPWSRPVIAPLASPILGAQPALAANPLAFPASMYDYGRRCCLRQFVGCPSPLCSSFAAQYFDESRQCCYRRFSSCNYPLCAPSVAVKIYDFGRDCCRRRAVGCHRPLCSVDAYSYYDEYRRCCYKRVAGCFHRPLCGATALPFYDIGNDCCYRRISGCHRPLCGRRHHRHRHHRHQNVRAKRHACSVAWGCNGHDDDYYSMGSSSSSRSRKSSSQDDFWESTEILALARVRNATRQEVIQSAVVTIDQENSES
uniref:Uncharacterized protein n=1 Tax=Romanomermis culicivorax TaxID=13658 RepID=A0A915I0E7_ROMCU